MVVGWLEVVSKLCPLKDGGVLEEELCCYFDRIGELSGLAEAFL